MIECVFFCPSFIFVKISNLSGHTSLVMVLLCMCLYHHVKKKHLMLYAVCVCEDDYTLMYIFIERKRLLGVELLLLVK